MSEYTIQSLIASRRILNLISYFFSLSSFYFRICFGWSQNPSTNPILYFIVCEVVMGIFNQNIRQGCFDWPVYQMSRHIQRHICIKAFVELVMITYFVRHIDTYYNPEKGGWLWMIELDNPTLWLWVELSDQFRFL